MFRAIPPLALLALALFWVQRQWRYDLALRHNDFAAATRAWPANPEAWRLLALDTLATDPALATAEAQRALDAGPEDWNNWAALARIQMESGALDAARASMAQMAARALGYQAHWRYANLLLLTGDTAGFWTQTAQALAFAPGADLPATLQQAGLVAGSDLAPVDRALDAARRRAPNPQQPGALALAGLGFYLDQNLLPAAHPWWTAALAAPLSPEQRLQLQSLAERYLGLLLESGSTSAASALFQAGLQARLFRPADGPTPANAVADPDFSAAQPRGPFAWSLCTDCGPWVSRLPAALNLDFHGNQADSLTLARQNLLLQPATAYRLTFTARAPGAAGNPAVPASPAIPAIIVQIVTADGAPLADLAASSTAAAVFSTLAAPAAYQLQILYRRPLGQMPLQGQIQLTAFSLAPIA